MFSFLKNYEGAHAGLLTKDAYRCACAYPAPERGTMGFSKGKDKLIPITVKLRYIESAAAKELQINDYLELLETENEKPFGTVTVPLCIILIFVFSTSMFSYLIYQKIAIM